MISAFVTVGESIERVLKSLDMEAVGRYGLTEQNLLDTYHQAVLAEARATFDQNKEDYYSTRISLMLNDGKFSSAGGTYTRSTKRLALTMDPVADANDIGRLIYFFNAATTPKQLLMGVITNYYAGSPTQYEILPFYDVPDLASVVNVTVGPTPTPTIALVGENRIFAPENLVIYDLLNRRPIETVSYGEFELRKSLAEYRESDSHWARYRRTAIDIANGTSAPPLGTVNLSAYFEPVIAPGYDSHPSISDKLIPGVESRFGLMLLAMKSGQPAQQSVAQDKFSEARAEGANKQLADKQTIEAVAKVR